MGMVLTRDNLVELRQQLRKSAQRVVFTNGCFDILHRGSRGLSREGEGVR